MATRTATITRVLSLLQISTSALASTDAGIAVDNAVSQYSKDLPLEAISHFAGQGQYNYDIKNVLGSWTDDFSVIKKIEYPVGSQSAELLEDIDWQIYKSDETTYSIANATSGASSVVASTITNAIFFNQYDCVYISDDDANEVNWVSTDGITSSGVVALSNTIENTYDATPLVRKRKQLRFLTYSPITTEVVRVVYSAVHTFSDMTDTIPANDYKAVTFLAAALAAYMISASYAKHSDSSMSADSVDYLSKVEQWKTVADDYYKKYQSHIGITKEGGSPSAASHTADWDKMLAWGSDRLFHGRRWY